MKHELRVLFHELVDLPSGERDRILRERQVAPDLRAEVEELLRFDSLGDRALTNSVASTASEMLDFSPGGWIRCGPYRLVQLLGSGGMGSVYLAQRIDGEIQQKVAVKLLHSEYCRPVWRDRFLKERQLLASLNHPSIVHVIDAGHTPEGRPYLVMEYVEGVPIDVYSERLALDELLSLFLRACEGVSHAHRHLIIHRDLKPSNILVDTSGQPKLLDFGIAKLLEETGEPTQTMERLLTPNYASPEQLRGAPQTTATDVYSLGAVLYKLLTGRSPRESAKNSTVEAALGISEIPAATQLNPNLPADIDFILRKALREEREERYASVEAFAGDIRAFLNSEPVEARSGDAWYRSRKVLRRYRIPVVAALVAIAGLSAGLVLANRERAIAQRRFLEVRQLANKLFDIDAEARKFAGSTKTRQLIVDTSLEYLRRLSADVHRDPDLALEIGNAYMRVARVQGVPVATNLGQMNQAEQNLRIADGFIRSVLSAQPSNRTAILRAAQIAHDRMLLARFDGRPDEALIFARESAEWLSRFPIKLDDRPELDSVMATYMNVAQQHRMSERLDEALRLSARGSEIARSLQSRPYLGMFRWVAAGVLQRRGDLEEALKAIQEAVELLNPGPGNDEQGRIMNYVLVLNSEGRILNDANGLSLGRPQAAIGPLDRAFAIADAAVHKDRNDQVPRGRLADAGLALGEALELGDAHRPLAVYDHVLQHLAEIPNNSSFRRYEVSTLADSVYPLRRLGRLPEARRRLDGAFERLRQLGLYPAKKSDLSPELEATLRAQAEYEAGTRNTARAIEIYRELLNLSLAAKPSPDTTLADSVRLSRIYAALAALHRQAGQLDAASTMQARLRDLWALWDRKLPNKPFIERQLAAINFH